MMPQILSKTIVILLISIYSGSLAVAGEFGASVSQSVSTEDNALSTKNGDAEDKKSETTLETNLQTVWENRSSNVDVNLDYSMSHLRYLQERFDNTNQVVGAGRATWHILRDRVSWFVANDEDYSIVDRRLSDNTDNRAQQSTFSTGPSATIPLSPVDSAIFSAEYSRSRNDTENDNSSEVRNASLAWSHKLSQTRDFLVSLSKAKTEFGNNDDDLETDSVEVTLNMLTASGKFSFGLGRDRSKRSLTTESTSNSFDVGYIKTWSQTTLNVDATRELSDTVTANGEQNSLSSIVDTNFDVEDALIRTTFNTSIATTLFTPVTKVTASAGYTEDDLQTLEDIQRTIAYDVGITHPLSTTLSVNSTYSFAQTRFSSVTTSRIDYDQTLSVGISYTKNERLVLGAKVDASLTRYGSEASVEPYDVENKSLTLTANYKIR